MNERDWGELLRRLAATLVDRDAIAAIMDRMPASHGSLPERTAEMWLRAIEEAGYVIVPVRDRTLTACDNCGQGYPLGEMVRGSDWTMAYCVECAAEQIDQLERLLERIASERDALRRRRRGGAVDDYELCRRQRIEMSRMLTECEQRRKELGDITRLETLEDIVSEEGWIVSCGDHCWLRKWVDPNDELVAVLRVGNGNVWPRGEMLPSFYGTELSPGDVYVVANVMHRIEAAIRREGKQ